MDALEEHIYQQIFHYQVVDLRHCFKGNLRVSSQKVLGVTSLPRFPDEMGNQRSQFSGSMVQTSNITFSLKCILSYCAIETL